MTALGVCQMQVVNDKGSTEIRNIELAPVTE